MLEASSQLSILSGFLFFLLVFVVVGVSSLRRRKKTTVDYLLAEHNVKPWLAGLSAVATNNSGYMFIGLIGFTYTAGLSSIWLMIGWILGDFVASIFIHRRLREKAGRDNEHTFAGVIAGWGQKKFYRYRAVTGLISLVFLGAYAAAQFNAGSKALSVLFGWDPVAGALIGAIIVLLYCFSGGIRASIWTDAAQSMVMIVAMAILLVVAIDGLGGWSLTLEKLDGVEEGFMSLFPSDLPAGDFFGPVLFVTGWFFAGFGVVGQPHIMVRFMALDRPENINRARAWYYTWFTLFYGAANLVGLLSRLYIPEAGEFDPELALPKIALGLLPGLMTGVILAGIFAATISTADSLILSCSASITNDFTRKQVTSYRAAKVATLVVTAAALGIALFGEQSVFKLVILSWAVLASLFMPVLIAYVLKWEITENAALFLSLSSVAILLLWRQFGLSETIYEIAPAVTGSLLLYAFFRVAKNRAR